MLRPSFTRSYPSWMLVLTASLLTHTGMADDLELRTAKGSWVQCEPIVGIATVRTGPVAASAEEGRDDWMVRQPIRKHLRLILYRDETAVCSSAAFFLEFFQRPSSNQGREYEASIFRILLERKSSAPRIHEYWKEPGKYLLVLVDIEHSVESNRVPLEILAAPAADEEAKRLFSVGEDRVGAMQMILQRHSDEDVEEAFQRLADLYPDSVYGRYARIALALHLSDETFKSHNNKGGEAAWGTVVARLSSTAPLLDEWNPLRHEAELALARAQVWTGSHDNARITLERLKSESPVGELAGKVWRALDELDKGSP